MLLENKNIVITGASSGIGEQVAKKAASFGARPILIARSINKMKKIAEDIYEESGINAPYYSCDIGKRDEVERTFQQILRENEHIDVLVNNAGYGIFEEFSDASIENIEGMFQVNVIGLMACTKAVLPMMTEQNRGHIINIASQAGKIATPKSSVYSATKHAVLGFSNSLRMELKHTNIAVSTVNPGPVQTNFFHRADKSGSYVKNVEKFLLSPDKVASRIIQLMLKPKREVNMPYWMDIGSKLYVLFPAAAEKIAGKLLDRK
ncbi:oxidoreductase [Compostibacillus humi]|uniref:Oxidoreductase n=1 Tax=Compostibacillus humi TaxID=1245525 RepID=A0A8J2TQM8_9BACI|nr:SDR family oxidoreductase [Compostibacillus humi]GFZ85684.1 oxidoreductase [Compostibacillus humi]